MRARRAVECDVPGIARRGGEPAGTRCWTDGRARATRDYSRSTPPVWSTQTAITGEGGEGRWLNEARSWLLESVSLAEGSERRSAIGDLLYNIDLPRY